MNLLAQASDVVWRLQTHWGWAPWITALFAAAVIAGVIACYRYEMSPAGTGYRGLLGLLRLTTIVLLLLMLSEAVFSGSRNGKPRLGVVLDRSASMERTDIAAEDGPKQSRLDAAKTLLTENDGRLLKELQRTYEVELTTVDAAATPAGAGAEAILESLDGEPSDEEESTLADNSATRLGDAITGLLDSSTASPLQGVVVLSDGQVTAGRSLADAAESARRAGAPLYVVGFGDEEAPPEARLADLVADETAFVDDLVTFQATLGARGLAGKQVRVDLLREGASEPAASQTLTLEEGAATAPVRLLDRPTEPGEKRYTLRATVLDGDDALPPSELTHTLIVRDDQIRVLIAAGYPNYEFRYLKQLLERDETIRVAHHLQEADPQYAEADLTALPRMPVRLDDLAEYDTLVLIDLDPTLLPRSLWDAMGRYVSERGGGVVLVSGPRSLPVAYRNREAFAAMAPTVLGGSSYGGFNERGGYRLTPTPLGVQTAAMELGDTPAASERVWRSLPSLYWRADTGPPKPAAQVLAAHPTARLDNGQPAPLIVSHYYGAGRVLLHATDSTYRWRRRVGDVFFARYWIQTLRSLARNKRTEAASSVELLASKRRYEPNEPVRLKLRDQRPEASPTDAASVVLQAAGRADRTIELPSVGGGGRYETVLRSLPPGKYRALLAQAGAEPVVAEFEVVAPLGEDARPEMNRAGLQAAAERSRGVFLTHAEADRLAGAIPPGRPTALESLPPYELWNRWPLLAGITACLTVEWILRKRRAML